ncbi:MAG: protein-disulfide reductase DsbD domain-containing protein [Pseudomonadota bacterium]
MIYAKTGLAVAAVATALLACAEQESPAAATSQTAQPSSDPFGSTSGSQPLPADEVFFPDVFAEADGSVTLGFRMLPGYYIYKDKIVVRSLTDGVELGEPELPAGEIVVDDWFGEQQVYFNDVMAMTAVNRANTDVMSADIEVTWQGCKEDELCYMPTSKVISVQLAAQVESAAD